MRYTSVVLIAVLFLAGLGLYGYGRFLQDSHVIENELSLLYAQQKYDELIEKSAAYADQPATHFWAGCAFIQKANLEDKKEAALVWLRRSEQEFRQALDANWPDWDTKYNFELARRLISDLEQPPKKDQTRIMKLLRPQPKAGAPAIKKVG